MCLPLPSECKSMKAGMVWVWVPLRADPEKGALVLVIHLGHDPEEHREGVLEERGRREWVKPIKVALTSPWPLWAMVFGDPLRSPIKPDSEISYLEIETLEVSLFVPNLWSLLAVGCPEGIKLPVYPSTSRQPCTWAGQASTVPEKVLTWEAESCAVLENRNCPPQL